VVTEADNRATRFFQLWPFTCSFSGLIVLGLYFKEISSLTSSKPGGFLDKLKWPCVGLLGLLWATNITQSFIQAFPVDVQNSAGQFVQFIIAIFALSAFCCIVVFAWGGVSLLTSVPTSSEKFSTVLVVVLVAGFAVCDTTISCFIYNVITNFIGGANGGPMGDGINFLQWMWIGQGLMYFGPPTGMLMVCFLFRVSVAKEIELSKSGTSSTSSSSKSSSSSSSSSDPVIEL